MKKLLSVLISTAVVFGMSVTPAFAGTFDPSVQTDLGVMGDEADAPISQQIPVYGYIGPDTTIVDPDPENPDKPPEFNMTDINVAVPVKILWAAFASDNGDITSPTYQIKNLSLDNDLDVSIINFEEMPGINTDAADLKDKLTLKIVSAGSQLGDVDLIDSSHAYTDFKATPYTAPAPLEKGEVGLPKIWNFTIGGEYSGTFDDNQYTPMYNIEFQFELAQ